MYAIAGSIVILAGSMVVSASVIAQELPAMNNRFADAAPGWAALGGVLLIVVGLVVLMAGMLGSGASHREPWTAGSTDIRQPR